MPTTAHLHTQFGESIQLAGGDGVDHDRADGEGRVAVVSPNREIQELLQGKLSDEEYERLVEQPAEDVQRVIDETRARDEAVAPSPAPQEDLQDLADYDTGAVSVGTTACGARVIAVVALPADVVLDEADQRAIRQHLADAVDGVDHVIDVSRERAAH
jgi:hypothetical protein